jgi:hypothetical protein
MQLIAVCDTPLCSDHHLLCCTAPVVAAVVRTLMVQLFSAIHVQTEVCMYAPVLFEMMTKPSTLCWLVCEHPLAYSNRTVRYVESCMRHMKRFTCIPTESVVLVDTTAAIGTCYRSPLTCVQTSACLL